MPPPAPDSSNAARCGPGTVNTMDTAPVRSLPLNTVMPVSGVSFRQDTVHTVVENDELRIRHDTLNPHDANACAVETLDGAQLGFVPRHLAFRLAVPHPGGLWQARVEEVLRGETWGLRVRLGPLVVDGLRPQPGAHVPGLRHRGDGVAENDESVVTAEVTDPRTERDAAPPQGPRPTVATRSGRVLGELLEERDGRVIVEGPNGTASYPAAVVAITAAVA